MTTRRTLITLFIALVTGALVLPTLAASEDEAEAAAPEETKVKPPLMPAN